MRKLCHAFCLVCNLAFGSSAAAGTVPAARAPITTSGAEPQWLQNQIAAVNYELRLIRFVDRYWPAGAGVELPPRISNLCQLGPDFGRANAIRDNFEITVNAVNQNPLAVPI